MEWGSPISAVHNQRLGVGGPDFHQFEPTDRLVAECRRASGDPL